jgi:hypothetical protein
VVLAFVTVLSDDSRAYEWNKIRWNQTPVPYYVNPANLDLPTNVIAPALKVGADSWALQSAAAFAFTYAGTSTRTNVDVTDGMNLVIFRNAAMGSAIATTYSWYNNNGALIEADIVFWDGGFQFFTGTTGCSNGFYIEDIATHEFGHALGLGHSAESNATMYPSTSYCNKANRSLDADDVAGVESIYGRRATTPPVPPAPTGLRLIRP